MWAKVKSFRPRPGFGKKIIMAAVLTAIGGAAFYLGRMAGPQPADAQQPGQNTYAGPPGGTDYQQRVVATIHGNIPITREELGEFLINRVGAERLDFLVNKKIVERACQAQNISVTEEQIDIQFKEDLKAYGGPTFSEKVFADQVLRKFNKSIYEWREDVIRPKLMMTILCRPLVKVTEEDIRKAYEARYGPKVKCRLIVLEAKDIHKDKIWKEVCESEAKFKEYARKNFITELAAQEGMAPPIHKHFPDDWIERQAFSMKPGEVSIPRQLQDGTWLIMRCEEHLPANNKYTFAEERLKLERDLFEVKLTQTVGEKIKQLREQAAPQYHLTSQHRQNNLDQQMRQEFNPRPGPVSTANSPVGKR